MPRLLRLDGNPIRAWIMSLLFLLGMGFWTPALATTMSPYGNYNYQEIFPTTPSKGNPLTPILDALNRQQHREARTLLDEVLAQHPTMFAAHELDGIMKANTNDLPGAESALRQAISLSPEIRGIYVVLGKVLFAQNKFIDAKIFFSSYIKKYPLDLTSHLYLGQLAAREGHVDQAIAHIEPLMPPPQGILGSQALLQLIRWHLDQGHIETAQIRLTQCDLLCRSLPTYSFIQGLLLYFNGKPQEAEQALTKLAQTHKNFPDVWLELGRIRRELRKTDEAQSAFQHAAEFSQQASMARLELAILYAQQEKLKQAIPILEDLIKENASTGAYELLAQIQARQGQTSKAISTLKALNSSYPDFAIGHVLMGKLQLSLTHQDAAQQSFTKAIGLDPTLWEGWFLLSNIHYASQQMKKAFYYVEKGIEASPTNPNLHIWLGFLWEKEHQWNKAAQAYKTALQHHPNFSPAMNNLAMMFVRLQTNLDESETMMRQLHSAQPNVPLVSANLGWVLVNRGNIEEGISLLEKSIEQLPDNAELHYFLSEAYTKQERTADADKELQLARKHGLPLDHGQQ